MEALDAEVDRQVQACSVRIAEQPGQHVAIQGGRKLKRRTIRMPPPAGRGFSGRSDRDGFPLARASPSPIVFRTNYGWVRTHDSVLPHC
jgi:hypothetical protein